jgi:hypothetical protein
LVHGPSVACVGSAVEERTIAAARLSDSRNAGQKLTGLLPISAGLLQRCGWVRVTAKCVAPRDITDLMMAIIPLTSACWYRCRPCRSFRSNDGQHLAPMTALARGASGRGTARCRRCTRSPRCSPSRRARSRQWCRRRTRRSGLRPLFQRQATAAHSVADGGVSPLERTQAWSCAIAPGPVGRGPQAA